MILAIDIGNTSITCGVFDGEKLVKKFRLPSDTELTVQEYGRLLREELGSQELCGAIIGSVVEELNNRIQYAVLAMYGVKAHILSHTSVMPIKLNIQNNAELGADRIANGVRGFELYKSAVIIVDFGTATTFDIVNSKGEFIGGLIAPGIKTQLNSLSSATEKLDEFEPDYIETAIGNTTRDAILAGVIRGSACMIDGMLSKCEKELGECVKVIATGGFCNIVSKYMERKIDDVNPDLTLEGLRDLFPANKPIQPVYKV